MKYSEVSKDYFFYKSNELYDSARDKEFLRHIQEAKKLRELAYQLLKLSAK